jgi:hypothetical protein
LSGLSRSKLVVRPPSTRIEPDRSLPSSPSRLDELFAQRRVHFYG